MELAGPHAAGLLRGDEAGVLQDAHAMPVAIAAILDITTIFEARMV